jgi:hypothetical protein
VKISIVIEGSASHKEIDKDSVYSVEQANGKALVNQQSYCRLSGQVVKALVPANVSTVNSQSSETSFLMLVSCYESCINVAASNGAVQIVVPPLGVGINLIKTSSLGNVKSDGRWGDLFWTNSKSSLAAKLATEKVCQYIPDDVLLTFVVQNEYYDEWDWAIAF